MKSAATTIEQYLAELPEDRRITISAIRKTILANLDDDYEEGMQYGMIGYYVPHRVYPPGYHCNPKLPLPFVALGSQKNYMALHLMCLYVSDGETENDLIGWFQKAWKATGKKLDMGKACIRFKNLEDVPLEVIGQVVKKMPARKWIRVFTTSLAAAKEKSSAAKASRKRSTATRAK